MIRRFKFQGGTKGRSIGSQTVLDAGEIVIDDGVLKVADGRQSVARLVPAGANSSGPFYAVDSALQEGRTAAINIMGDSTGNATNEWPYMLGQWLATRFPNAHVKYKVSDQASPYLYTAWQTIQAGADGERHAYFGGAGAAETKRTYYQDQTLFTPVTGDIDIRVRAAMSKWGGTSTPQGMACRYATSATNRSWYLALTASGQLTFSWSADGTALLSVASAGSVGFADNAERWVRATVDVDNGEGGYTARVYTSADGITWTQIGETKTTTGGATAIYNAVNVPYEIGGFGLTNYLCKGGKYFEAQIRNGIDGPIVNPQGIESWAPRVPSAPFEAGEYRGGATLYINNGSVSGADTAFLATTNFDKVCPPWNGALVIVSCGHNDGTVIEGNWLASRDAWQAKIDAKCLGSQSVWLTQNPTFSLDGSALDSVLRRDRRRQLLLSWAARKGVLAIDIYKSFLLDGRPLTDLIAADGVHPVQGADVAGVPTGQGVWRDAIIAAWRQASSS